MKIKLTIFLLLFNSLVFAQDIKTYNAKQEKDSDFFEYEDFDENQKPIGNLEFLKGCSWYCGGSVKSIKASSELHENNRINYSPKNAHDFDKNTAWIEGKSDYGIGEFIEYVFDFSENKDYNGNLGITKLIIANGYKKDKQTWGNNSRIKQMEVYLNDAIYCTVNLIDSFEIQTVEIGLVKFPPNQLTKLKFKIKEVYKGKKYKDTAISLLMFDGVGVH